MAAGARPLGLSTSVYRISHAWYEEHHVELSTPRGTLRVSPRSKDPCRLTALAGFPAGTTVATVPGGAGLIVASGLTGGDSMFSDMPMERPDPAADERLRARWDGRPPRVIVWSRDDLSVSFGVQDFGMDDAAQTGKWVAAHDRPITPAVSDFVALGLRQ